MGLFHQTALIAEACVVTIVSKFMFVHLRCAASSMAAENLHVEQDWQDSHEMHSIGIRSISLIMLS